MALLLVGALNAGVLLPKAAQAGVSDRVPAAAAAPGLGGAGWPQFHEDEAHTGFNAGETALNPSTVGGLAVRWDTPVGDDFAQSSPVVSGGRVFAGSANGALYALDAAAGRVLWQARLGTPVTASPAVSSSGRAYVGAGSSLYALDASTGHRLWTARVAGTIDESSPTISGGTVYVASTGGRVYAFDASTGATRWSALTGAVDGPVAVSGGIVYVASMDGRLRALSASDGSRRWTARAVGEVRRSSPAVASGIVYVTTSDTTGGPGSLSAFRASDGRRLWSATVGDAHSTPAVGGGRVFLGTVDRGMLAFDASTGAPVWRASMGGAEVWASPALADGVVYVTTDTGYLVALSASAGTVLLRIPNPSSEATLASPTVVAGNVYSAFGDGHVRAFRAAR